MMTLSMHVPSILAPDPKCRIMPEDFFDTVYTWLLHQVEIFTNFTELNEGKNQQKSCNMEESGQNFFLRICALSPFPACANVNIWIENSTKKDRFTIESTAPLICTLKSDFEGATWDFLGQELEKIKGGNHPDFFLGRHPIFFLIYLMKPRFF